MKRSILAGAAILVMAGAVRAADFGDLSGKTAGAMKAAAVKEAALVQVPEPQFPGVGFCSKAASADISAVCRDGEAVLRDPGAFTIKQVGDVIVRLDAACSSFPAGSRYRRSLDALRDAVDNAQREKVRRHFSGAAKSAAPAATASAAKDMDFDIRKVFQMPGSETWSGPFTIQFTKDATLDIALDILKKTGLGENAKELADNGNGIYAKIEMGDEFAWVKVMQLVDYTSVRSVQVNKRLWGK
ncbi:MAG: hypothetical protein PHV36_13975 [Elusimicrobiales bacterium]|nr:hypothetical protein [Elusimicrobiales bacterium]